MIPVGGIHISILPANPAAGFGYGVWARVAKGRVLVGVDETDGELNDAEIEIGSKTATPAGTNSTPTFTGSSAQSTSSVSAGTPAGTVAAPTFTGSNAQSTSLVSAGTPAGSVSSHAHELPIQLSSTTANRQIAAATFGTGTSRAATGASAAGSANTTSAAVALSQAVAPTFTGSALATHSHTLTPAGTNSAPAFTGSALATHAHTLTPAGTVSAPTFTGASQSNMQPSFTVYMWVRTS